MDDKEKHEKEQQIRKLAKEKKIVFAPQERIKQLQPYVDKVLKAIGVKGAWVSDESTLGDFWPLFVHPDEDLSDEEERKVVDRECAMIGYRLGLDEVLTSKDYIFAIAEKLEKISGKSDCK